MLAVPIRSLFRVAVLACLLAGCGETPPARVASQSKTPYPPFATGCEVKHMLASVQGELELRLISLGAGISRFGDREWCYRLVNGSDRSYWYVASDESCGGPSYWVLVSKKGKIERESPWWCGQGLRIVELPPLHGVDFSERNRWIEDATGVEVTISLDEQWTEEGETIVLTAERVPGNSPGSGG